MQTEIKISDVLHLAADKYLAKDYNEEQKRFWIKCHFSCDAIDMALEGLLHEKRIEDKSIEYREVKYKIKQGLEEMGCKTNSCMQFSDLEHLSEGGYTYYCTPESQAARYFWLKWAALMAEEQGE